MEWTDEQLDATEAICNEATPEPWNSEPRFNRVTAGRPFSQAGRVILRGSGVAKSDDLEFAAHARTALPSALAEMRRLRRHVLLLEANMGDPVRCAILRQQVDAKPLEAERRGRNDERKG